MRTPRSPLRSRANVAVRTRRGRPTAASCADTRSPVGHHRPDAESKFPSTTPEAAAATIVDGIERDKLHVFVGKDSRAMNVLVRLAPKQAMRLVQRQMQRLVG